MTELIGPEKPKETLKLNNLTDRLLTAIEGIALLHFSVFQIFCIKRLSEVSSTLFGKLVQLLPNHVTEFVEPHFHNI